MFVIEDKELSSNELNPALGTNKIIDTVKGITESKSFLKIDSVDFQKLMNTETPLLSKDANVKKCVST